MRDRSELEPVIAAHARERGGGMMVMPDGFMFAFQADITALAARYRIPATYFFRSFPEQGGLLSYANEIVDNYRHAASYATGLSTARNRAPFPFNHPSSLSWSSTSRRQAGLALRCRRRCWRARSGDRLSAAARMKTLVIIALAFFTASSAAAQTYPSRPVTMIVPFAPGGPTDTIARILAEHMRAPRSARHRRKRERGGGSIGVGRVARAAPDGYTLCVGNLSSHVMNGAVYAWQYDLIADFAPVALLSFQPMLIVASKSLPANDLRELDRLAQSESRQGVVGNTGRSAPPGMYSPYSSHKQTGTSVQLVPYRGAGPAMQDLVARPDRLYDRYPDQFAPSGARRHIKAYAVTAATRLASAPDIPTVDEAGLAGFHFSFWQALWAPMAPPWP